MSARFLHYPAAGLLAALGLYVGRPAWASVHTPVQDDDVVAILRPGGTSAAERELRTLRSKLAENPENGALALEVAQRCVERGRAEADPRYLGQAEVALAAWSQPASTPAEVWVLRATVHQSLHQFDQALRELDEALTRDPRHPQAWLTKATLHTVRGEYPEARRAASRLLGRVDLLTATAAVAQVAAVTGQATSACAQLEKVLGGGEAKDPWDPSLTDHSNLPQRRWAETILAEALVRLGRAAEAERHFRSLLASSPDDPYVLGAYADFLLDQKRPAEVRTRLESYQRIDGLLLRRAEAEAATPGGSPGPLIEELHQRFLAAAARGDRVHRREEARFELRLRRNAVRALSLSRENWAIQKEPADVRLLLEAARAASDGTAEAEILAWVAQSGLEDLALTSSRRPVAH